MSTAATFDFHWDGQLVHDETPSGTDLGTFDCHWDGQIGVPEEAAVTADYTVTGTINPDATGDYTQNGTHNGQPAYDRDGDGAYWIWANVSGLWFISAAKDTISPGWERDADTITGAYPAVAPATGTATVAAAVTSVIMNQMQFGNLGADLYNGALSV